MMNNEHNSPFVLTTKVSASPCHTKKTPLKGWSLAVKDVIDVAGLPTAAGNPTWLDTHSTPEQSADVVSKLLHAGACVIGKTITDELAYSLNGKNIHYPSLHNSLSAERLCGGSSSGSAIAVANKQARIGLGTDTGGSIRVPASYNNLVGFRPTHGAINTNGVTPLAKTFDTIGWLTHSVDDALEVANVVIEESIPRTASTSAVLTSVVSMCDYEKQFTQQTNKMFNGHHQYIDSLSQSELSAAANAFRVLQGKEIWLQHGEWITQNQPTFAPDIAERFKWASTIRSEDITNAKRIQQNLQDKLTSLFEQYDWLILPTTPGAAPKLNSSGEQLSTYREYLMAFTCIAGLIGSPQCHLPLFRDKDKAYGMSLIGPKGSDISLLQKAQILMEQYHEH